MTWECGEYLFFGLVLGCYLGGIGTLALIWRASRQSVTLKAWADGE